MSVNFGLEAEPCLFSSAHCWIAPSIWRRLLMQAFFCAVVLALMKLGIAIAAKRPIIATTIMISTNVNPLLRAVLAFIFDLSFSYGVNTATSGLFLFHYLFTYFFFPTVVQTLTGP